MPNFNCCVPGCTNSHRNRPSDFKFYCIPKDPELRRKYVVPLKNETLQLESSMTRVCADHWEGGEKLSRTHLPSIFPWTTPKAGRTSIAKFNEDVISRYKKKQTTREVEVMNETETDLSSETSNMDATNIQLIRDSETQTDLKCELIREMEKQIDLKNELESLKFKTNALQYQLGEGNRETSRLSFQLKNSDLTSKSIVTEKKPAP